MPLLPLLAPLLAVLVPGIAAGGSVNVIFANGPPLGGGIEVTIRVIAEDFEFAGAETVTVTGARFWASGDWDGTLEYLFFENGDRRPAVTPFASGDGMNVSRTPLAGGFEEFVFDLETPLMLAPGQTFWFGLHLNSEFDPNIGGNMFWNQTAEGFGFSSRTAEAGDFRSWGFAPSHHAFQLIGVPEPARILQQVAALGVVTLFGAARRKAARRAH